MGILNLAIIGSVVLAMGWIAMRHAKRSHAGLPSAEIVFQGTYTQAFQRTLDIVSALGATLQAADADRGTLTARFMPALAPVSPGGTLRIAIRTLDGEQHVALEAASPFVAIAAHSGQGLVDRFMQVWERVEEG